MQGHADLALDYLENPAIRVDDKGPPFDGDGAEATLYTKLSGDRTVPVRQEWKPERVALGELVLLCYVVAADPESLGAEGSEVLGQVPEVAAFRSAAPAHRGRIEVEDNRTASQELREPTRDPGLVRKLEIVDQVPSVHGAQRSAARRGGLAPIPPSSSYAAGASTAAGRSWCAQCVTGGEALPAVAAKSGSARRQGGR
jgi:hypothetical protein